MARPINNDSSSEASGVPPSSKWSGQLSSWESFKDTLRAVISTHFDAVDGFATQVGVGRISIERFLQGTSVPKVATMESIFRVVGLDNSADLTIVRAWAEKERHALAGYVPISALEPLKFDEFPTTAEEFFSAVARYFDGENTKHLPVHEHTIAEALNMPPRTTKTYWRRNSSLERSLPNDHVMEKLHNLLGTTDELRQHINSLVKREREERRQRRKKKRLTLLGNGQMRDTVAAEPLSGQSAASTPVKDTQVKVVRNEQKPTGISRPQERYLASWYRSVSPIIRSLIKEGNYQTKKGSALKGTTAAQLDQLMNAASHSGPSLFNQAALDSVRQQLWGHHHLLAPLRPALTFTTLYSLAGTAPPKDAEPSPDYSSSFSVSAQRFHAITELISDPAGRDVFQLRCLDAYTWADIASKNQLTQSKTKALAKAAIVRVADVLAWECYSHKPAVFKRITGKADSISRAHPH